MRQYHTPKPIQLPRGRYSLRHVAKLLDTDLIGAVEWLNRHGICPDEAMKYSAGAVRLAMVVGRRFHVIDLAEVA